MASVPVDYPYELGTWYHMPEEHCDFDYCPEDDWYAPDVRYHSREEQITNIAPPVHIEHTRRVVERIIKTPQSKRVGKIVQEDGKTHYFLDGKQVTRARFNSEQWF